MNASANWPPLAPTAAEQATTVVVGTYRSITGPGPRDFHPTPIYGVRTWKHGPQVLVNSIGGRAWINVSTRDFTTRGN
jgi:hypothetical protein